MKCKAPPGLPRSVRRKRRAFTLIELLIVVAIIAILAAIAVPNFLEAQTRAKVTRVYADMRSLSVAVESYSIDYNKYPIYNSPYDEDYPDYDRAHPGGLSEGRFERRLPVTLTTPIAYMTSLLLDPFPNEHADEAIENGAHPYHYSNDQDATSNPSAPAGLDQYPVRGLYTMVHNSSLAAAPYANESLIYMLLSHGPDLAHNNPDDGEVANYYDPTNGTVSSGDLYYFGPGLGSH